MDLFRMKKVKGNFVTYAEFSEDSGSYEVLWSTTDLLGDGFLETEYSRNLSKEKVIDLALDLIDEGWKRLV